MLILNIMYIIADAKTDIDKIASFNASAPLATSASELTLLPFFLTYKPSINLTIIPAISIINVT